MLRSVFSRFILSFLAFICMAAPQNAAAETSRRPSTRIIGGGGVTLGTHPYHAYVDITVGSRSRGCGGTLIDPNYVLTAAHCLKFDNIAVTAANVRVALNFVDFANFAASEKRNAAELIIHENHNLNPKENDIALIRLSSPSTQPPLRLISEADLASFTTGSDLTAIGFGVTSVGGRASSTLLSTQLDLIDQASCVEAHSEFIDIHASQLCAARANSGTCSGDSGGALIHYVNNQAMLAGITSFTSNTCVSVAYPAVYTRVSSMISWIENNTNDSRAPEITITSPTNGQSISANTIQISVNATDNIRVASVSYSVDNGSPMVTSSSPFGLAFDSSSLASGNHTLRAEARDRDGNITSASINFTKVIVAPTIVTHPASISVIEGQVASLSVSANGSALNYQWQEKNNADASPRWRSIAGATQSTYSFVSAISGNSKLYRVFVSNSAANIVSQAASVIANIPVTLPEITSNPQSVSVLANQTVSFSVSATGQSLNYRWQFRAEGTNTWKIINGPRSANYSFTAQANLVGHYRARVFNDAGAVYSRPARLTISQPAVVAPAITTNISGTTNSLVGYANTFSIVATGSNLSYQWQFRTTESDAWSNISSATSSSYTISNVAFSDAGQYRVIVSNSGGQVISGVITLRVFRGF